MITEAPRKFYLYQLCWLLFICRGVMSFYTSLASFSQKLVDLTEVLRNHCPKMLLTTPEVERYLTVKTRTLLIRAFLLLLRPKWMIETTGGLVTRKDPYVLCHVPSKLKVKSKKQLLTEVLNRLHSEIVKEYLKLTKWFMQDNGLLKKTHM